MPTPTIAACIVSPRTKRKSSRGVTARLFAFALLPVLLTLSLLQAVRPHAALSTVDRTTGPVSAVTENAQSTGNALPTQAPLTLSARSAVLMNGKTGEVYCEKNADLRLPMASTTKIMTALVVLDNVEDISTTVSVHPGAVNVEGSSIYLYAGERITVEALLYALLLESANDAAAALAYAVSGSIPAFAEKMNARAEAMGLTETHFENPHGLHADAHYTTARELGIITAEAMKNEQFCKIVSTGRISLPTESGNTRLLLNHNRLLSSYEGCIGVKTGYTKTSGRCLVSAAKRDGLLLVAVTLSAPDDWKDHRAMLDYGFSLYESVPLPEIDHLSFTLPVFNGCESEVKVSFDRGRYPSLPDAVTLPRDHTEITMTVLLPRFLWGEVTAGDTVGYAVYRYAGEIIAEIPLTIEKTVEPISYRLDLLRRLKEFFFQGN